MQELTALVKSGAELSAAQVERAVAQLAASEVDDVLKARFAIVVKPRVRSPHSSALCSRAQSNRGSILRGCPAP